MTSKVTAKLPLGVAFSMLLISLALFVGCKQDVAQDSYTPPGYGATVGYLTDTTWKSGNDTIKFGAEGSVTVPDSMKTMGIELEGLEGKKFFFEFGDFTYSVLGSTVTISAKVTKVPEMPKDGESLAEVGDIIEVATCTVGVTADGTSVKDYYQMKFNKQTFTMENRPTSGDKFVGTYYNGQGVKSVQINKDGTFVEFTSGGKDISYWQDNGNGTISVKDEPFTNSSTSGTSSSTSPTIYYLYPHALMSNGSAGFYK